MIVIPREALGYRGHSQIPVCTFMDVCVNLELMPFQSSAVHVFDENFFPFSGFPVQAALKNSK